MRDLTRREVWAALPIVAAMGRGGAGAQVAAGDLLKSAAFDVEQMPARIGHSEFIFILEGTVDFMHDDKVERVGPGGVIYVADGTLHQVKNVGDGAARYVVVAIGGDVKK